MIRTLRRTQARTRDFLGSALLWRPEYRAYSTALWGAAAGAAWLLSRLSLDPLWPVTLIAAVYLVLILAAVCAIDARYGIIPDSLVLALAAGGICHVWLTGDPEMFPRISEAALALAAAWLFRALYRTLRAQDGLGLGDVKFLGAAVLWVGIDTVPALLLLAVLSAGVSLVVLRLEGHTLSAKLAISFGPHLAIGLWLSWIFGVLS